MLRGPFNGTILEDTGRPVEGILTAFSGPHLRMDWDFYFCTLRLDNGEHVKLSIRDWDDSLMIGQRFKGEMGSKGIFEGHEHADTIKRADPPSIFKRLKANIAQKFGR
ncbi:MAG: hypothetical protein ACK45V_10410 [Brevundimonas sp.]|jgi:hypothetical protein|uniref:hypothetical protein n=1 Tax=Brevundimonas sp. TaxID=1871086 RepID=UPI0039195883